MVDLIEQCHLACDELIEVTGRATIQAVLQLSAMEAVGGSAATGETALIGCGVLWPPAGPGDAQRPQVGSGAATSAQQRAKEPRSRSSRLRRRAKPQSNGGADAGDSDARGLDTQLQGSHSGDGRDGGSFSFRRQPPGGRSLRSGGGSAAVAAFRRAEAAGDLHRRAHLR